MPQNSVMAAAGRTFARGTRRTSSRKQDRPRAPYHSLEKLIRSKPMIRPRRSLTNTTSSSVSSIVKPNAERIPLPVEINSYVFHSSILSLMFFVIPSMHYVQPVKVPRQRASSTANQRSDSTPPRSLRRATASHLLQQIQPRRL